MYGVVRRYTGAESLVKGMIENDGAIRELLSTIPGFVAYYALRTAEGGVATVTVCEDQAGTDESVRRAAGWIRDNLSGISMSPPEVTSGEVYLSITD